MSRVNPYLASILFLMLGAPSYAADDLASAQEMFHQYRYGEGLASLHKAAEAGDRQARLSLGLMLFHGEALYGPEVPRQHEAARRWLRLAAADGCEVSSHVLAKLEKRPTAQQRGALSATR